MKLFLFVLTISLSISSMSQPDPAPPVSHDVVGTIKEPTLEQKKIIKKLIKRNKKTLPEQKK